VFEEKHLGLMIGDKEICTKMLVTHKIEVSVDSLIHNMVQEDSVANNMVIREEEC
jgi:hypothetical protein